MSGGRDQDASSEGGGADQPRAGRPDGDARPDEHETGPDANNGEDRGYDAPEPTLDPEAVDLSESPAASTARGPRARRQGLTADGRLMHGKLAGLSMWGAIAVLSWPILTESFLNSLVGLTDTVLAAGLGEAETDAVGGASYIMWFIGLTIMALGIGATALISRSVGGGRIGVANAALGQTLLLGVGSGVVVAVLVAASAGPLALLMNLSGDAGAAFRNYLYVISLGVPFASVLFCGIACSRGAGDTIGPLWAMVVRNIVNIVVSFALSGVDITRTQLIDGEPVQQVLLANPFGFNLGVLGIAIGTVAGDIVGAAVLMKMAVGGRWGIRLKARWLRPHWLTARRIVRVGWPNFLETLGMWVGNYLIVLMVGSLGAGMLGAHIVAIRIEAFSFLPGFAMGIAAATLAGQYLGAGSEKLARLAVLRCAAIGATVMFLFGLAFMLFPRAIVSLLSSQPAHLEEVPRLLVLCGAVQVPFAIAIVFRQALRGVGDVRAVLALTWVTTYLVRLPLAYALSGVNLKVTRVVDGEPVTTVLLENPFPFEPSLWGLWLGMCLELIIRGIVFTLRYLQGAWTKKQV